MNVKNGLRLTVAAMAVFACVQPAFAQNRRFDIPAQPATTGIQALGTATGLQIVAAAEDVRGLRIAPVRGEMSAREAVRRALEGSGLSVVSDDGRTLVIKRVAARPTAALDDRPAFGAAEDEIIVTGIRRSLDQSLAVRRNASGIVDAVVAEDIGKLPDQNVIETLQRIPGVQIARVQGEGNAFVIRGISQNQIQFNGAMLGGPTSDGTGRLGEFNPEILAGMQVIKSPSADTTEGALGGTVNLVTKKPLDQDRFVAAGRIQGSYYDRAERLGYQASAMISAKTADDRLGLLLGFTRHDYIRSTHSFDSAGWTLLNAGTANQFDTNNDGVANSADQRNVYRPLRMTNNLLWLDHVRNGYNGAVQFRPAPGLEFSFDAAITDTMVRLDALRLTAILSNAAKDVTLGEEGTVVGATYTSPTLRSGNFQETYDTRQEIYSLAARFERGPWLVEARGTRSTGWRESFQGVPLLIPLAGLSTSATTDFAAGNDVPTFLLAQNYDPMDPRNWRLESNYETIDIIDTTSDEAKLDVTWQAGWNWIKRIKVGARYQDTKLSSLRRAQNPSAAAIIAAYPQADGNRDGVLSATELAGVSFSGLPGSHFLNGTSSDTVYDWLAGPTDFAATRAGLGLSYPEITLSTVRDTHQKQMAGYAMLDLDGAIGRLDVKGDAGLRYVHIDRTSGGYVIGAETYYQTYNSKFDYVLPSLNLRTMLTPKLQARLSLARVIANPTLTSVAPGARRQLRWPVERRL
ncbi:TonB-dependent receptor [Novosphingobium album (ex Liu et al. 2023)]|uniref:TonB-dependent receptor n=1 Tax=Novosphingobium album (ex Liu et al. 2023) TaxID=3031130 RepID=A0ABT5WTA6_9SPHN|nr:TonB-dependent receptor [Novosphingobium album (ex Liu et al. 2023)]MDE8652558.1 TonB-dependent receptor [Novosphingobium album (ex Liu et al. 2023)]